MLIVKRSAQPERNVWRWLALHITIQIVAMTLLKAINLNKDSVIVQDLLNDLDIQVEKSDK